MDDYFFWALQITTHGLEGIGILVIVGGLLIGAVNYVRHPFAADSYIRLRSTLGRAILLGLELLPLTLSTRSPWNRHMHRSESWPG